MPVQTVTSTMLDVLRRVTPNIEIIDGALSDTAEVTIRCKVCDAEQKHGHFYLFSPEVVGNLITAFAEQHTHPGWISYNVHYSTTPPPNATMRVRDIGVQSSMWEANKLFAMGRQMWSNGHWFAALSGGSTGPIEPEFGQGEFTRDGSIIWQQLDWSTNSESSAPRSASKSVSIPVIEESGGRKVRL